jgi:hypothetical protein
LRDKNGFGWWIQTSRESASEAIIKIAREVEARACALCARVAAGKAVNTS